jgi:hypothetical protein
LKKNHRDGSNTIVIGCSATLKDAAHVVRETIQKTKQTKYHEVSIPRPCLINYFHLIKKIKFLFKKTRFNKERQIKTPEITRFIFKISKKSYRNQIKNNNRVQSPIK